MINKILLRLCIWLVYREVNVIKIRLHKAQGSCHK